LLKKKANRYQELKEIEEEEDNKMEEELRTQIKKKEVCDLEEEKVAQTTYEVNKMSLKEVEKVCKQDNDYKSSKNNVKNREEEAGVSNDAAAVINDRMMIIQ